MAQRPNFRNRPNSGLSSNQRRNLMIGGFFALLVLFSCGMMSLSAIRWAVSSVRGGDPTPAAPGADVTMSWAPDSAELTIAASTLMAPVLESLADNFNALRQTTPDGQTMSVRIVALDPQKMVDQALAAPGFQAISPDSGLWIDRLEQRWVAQSQAGGQIEASAIPLAKSRTAEQVRYAVSPIVIAAWESVARELGWPEKKIGWQEIQEKAKSDPNFKWSHPSTSTATGLLATLAEFYAGANLTRGLTSEAATNQSTIDYVKAVESTVRFYGEGEEVVVQRLLDEGRNFLDAFVAQERVVIDWNENRASSERLVALYPAEGSFWTDHPLALLELGRTSDEPATTDNQRLTFHAFAQHLANPSAQQELLAHGYRPADLNIALDSSNSPFANSNAVDWRQPQTTLQMPAPAVIDVVLNFWYYTKRPTNVYLVVDTSGSMDGDKIALARQALAAFVSQIQGDRDRIAVVEFGSGTKNFVPLTVMDEANRQAMLNTIEQMQADGGTALIDAVHAAASDLIQQNDGEAINALVVMTDGRENESYYGLRDVNALLRNAEPTPVIFTIAFGDDADDEMLSEIARIGGGQFRKASETDIQELYKTISTYF